MSGKRTELDELFTIRDAALILGVSPVTVRSWERRGHLHQAVDDAGNALVDNSGRKVYRWHDLLTAEAATRRHARRA